MCAVDWAAIFSAVASGRMPAEPVKQRDGACVAVVLASGNYPYGKSEPAVIEGLERIAARGLLDGDPPPVRLYFAGVGLQAMASPDAPSGPAGAASGRPPTGGKMPPLPVYLATGGRVLVVSALGRDLSDARRAAYEAVGNLRFDGMQYRTDIGKLR
jgi:phosphoribosylamine--glycine ligase